MGKKEDHRRKEERRDSKTCERRDSEENGSFFRCTSSFFTPFTSLENVLVSSLKTSPRQLADSPFVPNCFASPIYDCVSRTEMLLFSASRPKRDEVATMRVMITTTRMRAFQRQFQPKLELLLLSIQSIAFRQILFFSPLYLSLGLINMVS